MTWYFALLIAIILLWLCWEFAAMCAHWGCSDDYYFRYSPCAPLNSFFRRKRASAKLKSLNKAVRRAEQLYSTNSRQLKTMSKQTVFLVKTSDSGCPVIRAPHPGEYFITEATGAVKKRKSPVKANMLRKIVEKHEVHPHFGLSDLAILEKDGGKRTPYTGQLFIGSNGKIGRHGHAGWTGDGDRQILRVTNGLMSAGKKSVLSFAKWVAGRSGGNFSDADNASGYLKYVASAKNVSVSSLL